MKNLLFIGCGNMGEAVLKALLKSGFSNNNIYLLENSLEKTNLLKSKYKIKLFSENKNTIFDICILAIKPQVLSKINFSNFNFSKERLLISILAGTTIKKLNHSTNFNKIIRVMPNLPLVTGQGMTTYFPFNATEKDNQFVKNIFEQSGKILKLNNEEDMHLSTLIAGSGPGLYYYLCTQFQEIAEKLGFSKEDAKILTTETLIGSANLLSKSQLSAAELEKQVSSKGGTTEAAVKSLKENKINDILKTAILEGIEKSKKLEEPLITMHMP